MAYFTPTNTKKIAQENVIRIPTVPPVSKEEVDHMTAFIKV